MSNQRDTCTCDPNHEDIPRSYALAVAAGVQIGEAVCSHCGAPHIDLNEQFATDPHKKHLCDGCGKQFELDWRGVCIPSEWRGIRLNPLV